MAYSLVLEQCADSSINGPWREQTAFRAPMTDVPDRIYIPLVRRVRTSHITPFFLFFLFFHPMSISARATPPPANAHLAEQIAPQLFGMFFNWGLMGSLVVQVYFYYCAFPKDRKVTKIIVYGLFLLELAETLVMCDSAYRIFGANYGDVAILNNSKLTYIPGIIIPSFISLTVQVYYASRVRTLSGSRIPAVIITIMSLLQFSLANADGIQSGLDGKLSHVSHRPFIINFWLSVSALCDITIAALMIYYLRKGTVISSVMKNTVAKAIRYTIATGSLTAFANFLQIFLVFAFRKHNYFVALGWTQGKLYSNNLLVLLNMRAVHEFKERERGRGGAVIITGRLDEIELGSIRPWGSALSMGVSGGGDGDECLEDPEQERGRVSARFTTSKQHRLGAKEAGLLGLRS
ncbi:hypothetical protein FB45DRAFT_1064319 [Roridomyces roridus]|uniref:DUF6534 domain-containing protein n=1 Tax=Roridomyces roridus TaxID=1738132 RepID=A0AAD7BAP4_9AGAR|nr:hypothetical protein FB45DRAFT_1064319 [Roridomyces roridus]